MTDPFLFELMHRAAAPIKLKSETLSGPLNEAFENAIKAEVEAIRNEKKDFGLLSEEAVLKKIEAEVRKEADLTEFGEHIEQGIYIIRNEGQKYLEKEAFEQLNLAIDEISHKIQALDLKNFTEESLQNALSIPDPAANSILKIAIDKFSEGLHQNALNIFSFLTLVCPDEPEYWYRMGLVAHKDGQHELAVKAFQAATALNKDFLEPRIFAAESYIDLKEYDEAQQELSAAKKCQSLLKDQSWGESIAILENLIENREVI